MNTYEQFVFDCYEKEDIKWMPLGECISLKSDTAEDGSSLEDEVIQLRSDLDEMKSMVKLALEEMKQTKGK